ncbi:MAG: hypothetical protein WCF67_18025 [Chitinophagaceae bacterium]
MANNNTLQQTNSNSQHPSLYPILHSFFDLYHLHSCEETMWKLLTAYIGQDDADLEPPIDRSNTVYFCRNVNKLLKELNKLWEEEYEQKK